MADPLSIVASAISIVGAAKTVSKTLSTVIKLRKLDVPDELMTLVNEVSDLRSVVDQVCQIVDYDRPDSVQPSKQSYLAMGVDANSNNKIILKLERLCRTSSLV